MCKQKSQEILSLEQEVTRLQNYYNGASGSERKTAFDLLHAAKTKLANTKRAVLNNGTNSTPATVKVFHGRF
jgi:uncharacterized protein YukE